MIRPKSTAKDLPPRMLRRTKTLVSGKVWVAYYYNGRKDGKRVEIPLGPDLNEAKRKWAELECISAPVETGLMGHIFDRYEREVMPSKAPRTRKDNLAEMKNLRIAFGAMVVDAITPQFVARYRDARSAKTRANREIALLSHVFNMAREWGYTAKENPCRGVRRNKETPRSFYADDEVWGHVLKHAVPELVDAMELAYQTGQRPADVLKMKWSDVRDGAVEVKQGKTAKLLRILLKEGDANSGLGKVIERIRLRKTSSFYLISTANGQPLNQGTLRTRFDNARDAAALSINEAEPELAEKIRAFQFRDIRPKAASEIELSHAQALLGHSKEQITQTVYRRVGATVKSTT